MFGSIDRKIRQVFPWGINTLTFPPKEWGAEPTPHSPPSREGSGGGGFGREPTPHCRIIYSYIHKFLLERAPQCHRFGTQKSAALPCFRTRMWTAFISVYSNERRTAVFLKMEYFWYLYSQKSTAQPYLNYAVLINNFYSRVSHYRVLENGIFYITLYSKARRSNVF